MPLYQECCSIIFSPFLKITYNMLGGKWICRKSFKTHGCRTTPNDLVRLSINCSATQKVLWTCAPIRWYYPWGGYRVSCSEYISIIIMWLFNFMVRSCLCQYYPSILLTPKIAWMDTAKSPIANICWTKLYDTMQPYKGTKQCRPRDVFSRNNMVSQVMFTCIMLLFILSLEIVQQNHMETVFCQSSNAHHSDLG